VKSFLISVLLAAALLACNPPPPVVTVHGANLSWTDRDAAYIQSYTVYKSNTAGGPYTILAKLPGNSYFDKTCLSGFTCFYVVTATAAGIETVYSKEVRVAVP